jgi:hypothetical protein
VLNNTTTQEDTSISKDEMSTQDDIQSSPIKKNLNY